ncbi:Uncharacterized protein HZ326_30809 [Fusarium oxysporum f. sp. albedinis]|nr:Uncharacterized protein HZ326_30809 [Fusarium oxysporum f. sp. albedinis]
MVSGLRTNLDAEIIAICQVLRSWYRAGLIKDLDPLLKSHLESKHDAGCGTLSDGELALAETKWLLEGEDSVSEVDDTSQQQQAEETVHPWGKPSQEKNPRRLERCSVDEVVASFHGLQVSSVPLRPSGFVYRGCKEEEGLWAVHDCRDRSCSFRAAKRAASHFGAVRRDKGGPEGPESRAAEGCLCCSGS